MRSWLGMTFRVAAAIIAAGAGGAVVAGSVSEPTDVKTLPFPPHVSQVQVVDQINGRDGRLNAVLGHFNPAYSTLRRFSDSGSLTGNGAAPALLDIPFEANGSLYVRVSGGGDEQVDGTHSVLGAYRIWFEVLDEFGAVLETIGCPDSFGEADAECTDALFPGEVDNHWLSPVAGRAGLRANVYLDNLVGPGTSNSLDYFMVTDLPAGTPFDAEITDATFDTVLGMIDPDGWKLTEVDDGDGNGAMISSQVPTSGQVLLGVSGFRDLMFTGEHPQLGDYTLEVRIVPEPWTGAALTTGLVLSLWGLTRRRRSGVASNRSDDLPSN